MKTLTFEAESVAYTVCQHYGIDTSDYSFGYIAGWSSGKDLKELKSSLDTIRTASSELINAIDSHLEKDMEHDAEKGGKTDMAQEKAWDEVNGIAAEDPDEKAAKDPVNDFWSRKNYMRAVEDAEEQNDNQFDGIINNTPDEKERHREEALTAEEEETVKKESIIKKLQEEKNVNYEPPVKPLFHDDEERIKL
ncbi:MAG: DUF4316 domain-containing protein [Lachnospiraceae bacterium]|nr:DUF4316 domain-containing protein [Lachnospiraceae bacterium]